MSERGKSFWLGIFIIAAIAILSWLILFLKPSVGDGRVTLHVRFANIDKIDPGTRVTFAGKPVGEVEEIQEVKDPRQSPADSFGNLYIYLLTLKVDSSVHIYTYDEIVFATSGLLGEKSIAILPKVTPPGAPPAQEVTGDILFAESTDKLQVALSQLTEVAETFESTMTGFNDFLATNNEDFNRALTSVHGFFGQLVDTDVARRFGSTLDTVQEVTGHMVSGKGTIAKLISSDTLYLQVMGLINKSNTLLNNLNNYGLLYQFSSKWKKARDFDLKQKRWLLQHPADFYNELECDMGALSLSLENTTEVLHSLDCLENTESVSQCFEHLSCEIDRLRTLLKLYTEILIDQYGRNCQP